MAYEVLARKWRPQQFDDVVGQGHVTETLKNAIQSNRLAHAYLFVGPRGIGKTSVARIFAKALNCAEGPTETPCDKCDSCREISAGSSLDVLEIDGASNNGVEQVRDLRETVKYAPARGPFKIYIIDEVHMLSIAAFNALLKTLEEPPSHVKFVFATTEPQKILATIVSRCQRFDLRRISVNLIMERLRLIGESEKVTVSEDALLAIARGAEGGLRDAESALDQLISFKGNSIEESDVLSVFGLVSRQALESLAEKVLSGDVKGLIQGVAELDEAGKDLQRLVFELMAYFRNLLVCMYVDDVSEGLDLATAQVEVLKKQCELTSSAHILRVMQVLTDAEERMRYALSRRTLLETALIRCARAATVVTLEQVLAELNKLREGGSLPEASAAPRKKKDLVTPPDATRTAETAPAVKAVPAAEPAVPEASAPAPVPVPQAGDPEEDLEILVDGWDEVLAKVGKLSLRARSFLVDARPLKVEGDRVVIGFDPEFAEEIGNFKAARNRSALERALESTLKRKVVFELKVGPARPSMPAAGADGKTVEVTRKPAGKTKRKRKGEEPEDPKRRLLDDPAVQKTLETFNGSIFDVRA